MSVHLLNQRKISALYVAVFNRAPDKAGLDFWSVQATANPATVFNTIAAGFSQHPVFSEVYASLNGSAYVNALYTNILGSSGDAGGVAFWTNQLTAGRTKSEVLAAFVQSSLETNLSTLILTPAELAAAQIRQQTITNKANVGVQFATLLGTASNLATTTNPSTLAGLRADPAYLASVAVISNVSHVASTASNAIANISVAAASGNPIAYLTPVVIAPVAPVVGQTFTLTAGVDNVPGGAGNDTISGVISNVVAANTVGTTFQAGDIINGGNGVDTVSIAVTGGAVGTNAAVRFNSVEKVMVSNVNGAAQSISLSLADADLTTVGHLSSNTNAVTTFTGLRKIVGAELANGDGGITVTYDANVVAGSADAMNLVLSNQTGGTFTTNGIETLNIASNTIANTLTLAAGPATVTVSGDVRLTLGALDAAITVLDATANTGGLTATMSATTTARLTGSAGNDIITAGTALTGVGAVNGGAGIDTLVTTADALIATAALGARYTNFETLSVSTVTAGDAANAGVTTRTQDMSLISGITTVNVTATRAAGGDGIDTSHAVTLSNLAATTNTLNITGLANADATATDDFDVTVTATRALNTTSDAITVNLGTATATVGTTGTATGQTTVAGAAPVTLALSLANEESITLNSLGGATGTNFLAGITNTAATSVTATGARALSFASMSSQVVTSINAGAMTGAFIMGTNAGTVASTITGGSAGDTLVGGSAADNINGGAGNDLIVGANGNDIINGGDGDDTIEAGAGIDNLSGGAGNDTFQVSNAAHFINLARAETVSGGEGNDNLLFVQVNPATNWAISATDLLGINSIETITINGGTGTGSITLSDAVYTANGLTTLNIVDGLLTGTAGQGTLTVNAAALSAANSVRVTGNTAAQIDDTLTGGAGNDTFVFSTATGLQATDTVVGGAGTDTISLTATAAVTAVLSGVRTVERVVTTGTGGNAIITVGNDAVIAVGGTLTVDASSITNGAFSLNYDGAAVNTATKSQNVTGTAGDDTITGGSGNDVIVGGDGIDLITGGEGTDNLSGGAGNDIFVVATLGAGFVGLTTAETVSGGTGNDTLRFTAGAVTIAASDLVSVSGIEVIQIQNTTEVASLTLTDAFYTTNGAATLAVNASTMTTGVLTLNATTLSAANSVQLNLSATTNNAANVVNLGAGNDTVTANMVALDNGTIAGGAGTDTLVISDNQGNAAITAVATITGFETINFTEVANVIHNLVVNDANVAAGITQTVNGSSLTTGRLLFNGAAETNGRFSITGGNAVDNLIGGSLADTINGGAGADVITGGLGADVLTGGIGADTFVYDLVTQSSGVNVDTITDFTTGTDKLQVTLNYATLTNALDINAVRSSAGLAGVTLAQDTLSGQRGQYVYDTATSSLFINVNADNLLTTADYRVGINAASTAANSIVDGDINFVITGGTNADVIATGAGNDTITGGAGADTLVFRTTQALNGTDTILGFAAGAGGDIIDFSFGDGGVLNNAALRGDGTRVQIGNATGALAIDTNAGLVLNTTAAASNDVAGVVAAFANNTGLAANDIFYYIAGDNTNASIFRINTGATAAVDTADVELLVNLTGVTTANLAAIGVAQFADFIAV